MKTFLYTIVFLSVMPCMAQVGIGNTEPKAVLDISVTDSSNPTNMDGVLIPRIDAFPTTNPTADQDSMLIYLTATDNGNPSGFYYWNNTTTLWVRMQDNTAPKMQFGSSSIGDNTSSGFGWKTVAVTFPNAFSSVPVVTCTPRNEWDVNDTFSVTIIQVTTTGFTLNVQRLDQLPSEIDQIDEELSSGGGTANLDQGTWGQNLHLDWIAIGN